MDHQLAIQLMSHPLFCWSSLWPLWLILPHQRLQFPFSHMISGPSLWILCSHTILDD
jgi:hypothetical protein